MSKSKYDPIVQEKLKDLRLKIKQTKLLDEDVKLVKELIPSGCIWLDHEVNVNFPVKSKEEITEILRVLAKGGIHLNRYVDNPVNPIWYMKGLDASIRLVPSWSREGDDDGATCKLVKIGEEVVTYPKYKLMCEGGNDAT
jgi:hypothetical protein